MLIDYNHGEFRVIAVNTNRKFKIDPPILFLVIATFVGGYIRLFQALEADFPLNDGGLFYAMTNDLMVNGYQLPLTTSFNQLNLPFAYPPLAFYFSGFLADLTSWQLIDIIRILPPIFSILSIPAFYLLAQVLIKNKYQLIFATIIFTFIPASFEWLIMGGGLTRSPAFFLTLLSLYFIYKLYTQDRFKNIFLAALFSSMAALTHLEAALHIIASALVFFLFFGRNKRGVLKSLAVTGLTLVATSPWWITVLSRHGFSPFLAASGTGFYDFRAFFQLLFFTLTHEYGPQTIGVLGLIGIFWYIYDRNFFVPLWLFATYFVFPRSGALYAGPCIAILASYSLTKILMRLNRNHQVDEVTIAPNPLAGKVSKGLFLLLFFQWFYFAIAALILGNFLPFSRSDKDAFDWIKTNTPDESQFLVLTGKSPLFDPVSEWFPALTDRTSIATMQGLEWDSSISFVEFIQESNNVQKCIGLSYQCIENWMVKNQKNPDYLYIHNPGQENDIQISQPVDSALGELSVSIGFTEIVYRNEFVVIYKVK